MNFAAKTFSSLLRLSFHLIAKITDFTASLFDNFLISSSNFAFSQSIRAKTSLFSTIKSANILSSFVNSFDSLNVLDISSVNLTDSSLVSSHILIDCIRDWIFGFLLSKITSIIIFFLFLYSSSVKLLHSFCSTNSFVISLSKISHSNTFISSQFLVKSISFLFCITYRTVSACFGFFASFNNNSIAFESYFKSSW
jgi:hypothetical protein